jgi:hypothetical protein
VAAKSNLQEDVAVMIKDDIIQALKLADNAKLFGTKLKVAISGYTIACNVPALREYKPYARTILRETYETLLQNNRVNSSYDLQYAHELLNAEDKG